MTSFSLLWFFIKNFSSCSPCSLLCPRSTLPCPAHKRHKSSPPASGPGPRRREICVSSLPGSQLSEHTTAPTNGSACAAGYELYSAYDYTVPPMEKVLVKTDIQIALPSGCYGRVGKWLETHNHLSCSSFVIGSFFLLSFGVYKWGKGYCLACVLK